jgi:hypothetical protein
MTSLIEHRSPDRHTPPGTRLLIVLAALCYALMSQASIVSTSHDPAHRSGHDNATLLAAHTGDDGHSHDDPQTDDRSAGHQHGGHTTDHSHDKPNLPRSDILAVVRLPDIWGAAPRAPACPESCLSIERPPESLLTS